MVNYAGLSLIERTVLTLQHCGVKNIACVSGYRADSLRKHLDDFDLSFFQNDRYASTNMVYSLCCARDFCDDDLVISYSDIQYTEGVLNALLGSKADVAVVVDRDWRSLWEMRMDDPQSDVESLKLDAKGRIASVGEPIDNLDDVEGQYIGLIKVSRRFLNQFFECYSEPDSRSSCEKEGIDNMYMTSLLQTVIRKHNNVEPVFIDGQWLEIDTLKDLQCYEANHYLYDKLLKAGEPE